MAGAAKIFEAFTMLSYLFFHWKGALTENSIQMKLFVNHNLADTVQQWSLIYYQVDTQDIYSKQLPIIKSLEPIAIILDNLKPLTNYKYFFYFNPIDQFNINKINEIEDVFYFKTLQIPFEKQNISFVFSSCAKTGSENSVFTDIMELFPENDFFVQMGDIFYSDIIENDEMLFDESYYRLFQSRQQKQLYQYYPIIYIWDDHDFGDNNSGQSSLAKEAATISFLKNVNYYPFRALPQDLPPSPPNKDGIYQYKIMGQTLLIIMDLRTHFVLEQRAMDDNQEQWLLTLLDWCEKNEKIDNLVIVSSIPWLGQDWVSFKEQRQKIGDAIGRVNKVKQNVLMITGDSHMNAFDNGYNNDAGGFAHCVSSPLDKTPSCKGGKYTYGPYSGNQQFTSLDITYDPITNKNCFLVKGWRSTQLLYSYDFCNEDDRNIKRSNQCFASIPQIFLVSILPLFAVAAIIFLIWKKSHQFTALLSKNARLYEQVPQNQQRDNQVSKQNEDISNNNNNNNLNTQQKLIVPNYSFQGKSNQKLSNVEMDMYGNLTKSPSCPSQIQPNSILRPSELKQFIDKEINIEKEDYEGR